MNMSARAVLLCLAWAASTPASAQLMLPQAPAPGGSPAGPSAPAGPAQPPPPPRPVAVKIPGEATVLGRTLLFNGTKGRMIIERRDRAGLAVTVIAVGEKMSAPGEACGLDLGGGRPLELSAQGRPNGVPRFRIDIPACPLDVDLLDGAVLVSGADSCPFPEGNCRIDARGLWGPGSGTLEGQLRAIETDRAAADRAVRENFKALLARTKDRNAVKQVAAEQAGFTSERETLCRDYARESVHGFCSARFTELRAAELAARVEALGGPPPVAATPRTPRPPATPGAPAVGQAPSQPTAVPPPAPQPSRSIFDIFR
jgi:hypothetical protein